MMLCWLRNAFTGKKEQKPPPSCTIGLVIAMRDKNQVLLYLPLSAVSNKQENFLRHFLPGKCLPGSVTHPIFCKYLTFLLLLSPTNRSRILKRFTRTPYMNQLNRKSRRNSYLISPLLHKEIKSNRKSTRSHNQLRKKHRHTFLP